MKKQLSVFFVFFLCIIVGVTAGNYPFPQNSTYPYGIKPATPNTSKIASLYNAWVDTYYKEGSATVNGKTVNAARIEFDDPGYSVSEGIAYGMLIFVYMDGVTETNTFKTTSMQTKFDRLYNYYSAWSKYSYGSSGRKYLMNWKIQGFSTITSANSATDAEIDIALALLMAHKQWGSTGTINYAVEAENLMTAIYEKEVDPTDHLLYPGDAWYDNVVKNPCYFETAALKLFDVAQTQIGFTTTKNWSSVYSACNTFLKDKAQNTSTGLFPDWCNSDGSKITSSKYSGLGYDFNWDACRTPWRVAWDYVWWGSTEGLAMSERTANWLNKSSITPSNCASGYSLTGSALVTSYQSPCFVGGLAPVFMANAANSSTLQSWYDQNLNLAPTASSGKLPYYGKTIQILYALTMSGNTPNFYGTSNTTNPKLVQTSVSTDGTKITMTFDKAMSSLGVNNYKNQFSVTVNGTAVSISTLSQPQGATSTLVLSLGKVVANGDIIKLSYTGSNIQDANGNLLQTFSNYNVSNNVPTPGVYGYIENFNDNSLATGWGNDNNNDFTFDESGQVLNISASYSTAGWVPFSFQIPVDVNVSQSQTVTMKVKSSSAFTMRVDMQDANGYTTNSSAVTQNISASSSYTTYTFTFTDFSEKYHSDGTSGTLITVDKTKIKSILIYTNPGDVFSGSFSIDDLIVGIQPIAVTSLSLNSTTASLNVSESTTLIAIASPSNATNKAVTWVSSNTSVATVGNNGVVNAIASGIAIITAKSIDNSSIVATCTVTVSGAVVVNKTALQSELKTALEITDTAKVGTHVGQYSQTDLDQFELAIKAADDVNKNTTATQLTVDDAVTKLQNAIAAFTQKAVPAPSKTALNTTISIADNLINSSTPGDAVGQYPQLAMDVFSKAINAAKLINSSDTANQSEVDAAQLALSNAITAFNASKNTTTTNYTVLNNAILAANLLAGKISVGSATGQVSQEAKTTFETAIITAQFVASNPNATQSQINSAAQTLNDESVIFANSVIKTAVAVEDESAINVYPIPCKTLLTIDAKNEVIKNVILYNSLGITMIEQNNVSDNKIELGTESLTTGVYYVKIICSNGKQIIKTITK